MTIANGHPYQVQIGSSLIPGNPVSSVAESYSQLKTTVGRAFKMHSSWCRSHEYIIGLGLGRISGAGSTRRSTKSSDLLILNFEDCDANGAADSVPAKVFCPLKNDCDLNIANGGITLLDQLTTKSYSKWILKKIYISLA